MRDINMFEEIIEIGKRRGVLTYDEINRLVEATGNYEDNGQTNVTKEYVYDAIGNIVEKVTGTPYEDFVIKNLFQPLGMKNASFGLNAFVSADNHAVPHVRRKGLWVPTKVTQNYYNVAPAAGVNASILDMGQWLLAHLGQRPDVLSETTLNSIQSRVIKTSRSQAHSTGTAHLRSCGRPTQEARRMILQPLNPLKWAAIGGSEAHLNIANVLIDYNADPNGGPLVAFSAARLN